MHNLFSVLKLAILLGLIPLLCSFSSEKPIAKPNIVWFVSEDNAPYLGVYGNPYVHTPNLDKFAASSVLYENAFSNAPVCAPSRSGIITGVLPVSMGTQHMRSEVKIDDQIRFFTSLLQENGYYTTLRRKRDYNIVRDDLSWDDDDWWDKEDALNGRKENQPFFLFYNTFMTHEDKLHGPQKIEEYFQATFSRLGKRAVDSLRQTIHVIDPDKISVPEYLPDIPEVRKDLAHYYQCMEMMDLEFKLFLDYLKSIGELENTIVIYASDHGGVMGRSKRFAFETGLKVPLMIRFPEKYQHMAPYPSGSRVSDLVTFLDLTPSILSMAGVPVPEFMQGSPLFVKENQEPNEFVFGFRDRMDEAYDQVRIVRNKKYRYIQSYMPQRIYGQHIDYLWKAPHVPAWENLNAEGLTDNITGQFWKPKPSESLYDVENDPFETKNLASDPRYASVVEEMRYLTMEYLKSIGDLGFVPEGILWENYQQKGLIYQKQFSKEILDRLIEMAFQAVNNPSQELAKQLSFDENPAFRFWGAMAYLQNGEMTPEIYKDLMELSKDERGDVRVMAAESLYLLGKESDASVILEKEFSSENPFVIIRALGVLISLNMDSKRFGQRLIALSERRFVQGEEYIRKQVAYLINNNIKHVGTISSSE
ncbi:sulfatase-like hydrolase/transferase [Cecembia calidifontis]|jgi:arylsulfatase A-like enzyme|uniref:Arylsulfatase A-like enzyme n=1 Tax=Cecembia calidifontis TaxID=1187080 RepID=A0A4Q7P8U3_9BACT|nr:sulfatase-like hydrolase/transferase [Cecembia calidifontis]RZS96535.1 arylsulfatase A-like enzyme [Cecembia calidifontis]